MNWLISASLAPVTLRPAAMLFAFNWLTGAGYF
jgi:hypothetical protein